MRSEPEATINFDEDETREMGAPADDCKSFLNLVSEGIGTSADAVAGVFAFCEQHRVTEYVDAARKIVEDCFRSRKALRMRLDQDPEEDGECIVIEVQTGQDVESFLEAYARCISLWTEKIPTEALALIRLSYDLA